MVEGVKCAKLLTTVSCYTEFNRCKWMRSKYIPFSSKPPCDVLLSRDARYGKLEEKNLFLRPYYDFMPKLDAFWIIKYWRIQKKPKRVNISCIFQDIAAFLQ